MRQRIWIAIAASLCLLPFQRAWGEGVAGGGGTGATSARTSTPECGGEGQTCCEKQQCFTFMLECVKGRCQESRLVHVLRDGGTYTDERGYTTKVEISGDFKLMTIMESGRFLSSTLYDHEEPVWRADRDGEMGVTRRSTPITLEEAKRMYLAAEPRFDDGPPVHLNLVNVPFREAAEYFMKLSHQHFNLSQPCRGTVTIVSDVDLKPAEAFSVFVFMVGSFQLEMESPLQAGPTIHSGNVYGCACTLDDRVVTRVFALHHLTQDAVKGAPESLARIFARHLLAGRYFVVTERPEMIRQIGFWLEKQDRLDSSGKPVFLPDSFPRELPFHRCPVAF